MFDVANIDTTGRVEFEVEYRVIPVNEGLSKAPSTASNVVVMSEGRQLEISMGTFTAKSYRNVTVRPSQPRQAAYMQVRSEVWKDLKSKCECSVGGMCSLQPSTFRVSQQQRRLGTCINSTRSVKHIPSYCTFSARVFLLRPSSHEPSVTSVQVVSSHCCHFSLVYIASEAEIGK